MLRSTISIKWVGGSIFKELLPEVPEDGVFPIELSVSETRSIPVSASASYEVEKHFGGEQETLLYGSVTAKGGVVS